ncbi:MAG: hypothetical protein ACFFD5_04095 [Candidatus Thorarchaeota archaeon]
MPQKSEDMELDYYLKIVEFFQSNNVDQDAIEIWKNESFIELMKVLKRTKNKEFVKNALILIISLFGHVPPDLFNNRGISTNILNEKDKASYLSILKTEFANQIPN